METGIKVGDCMEKSLVTVPDSANAAEAASKMASAKVSSLMVTDDTGKISAIVTETDLVRKALALGRTDTAVKEMASTQLVTIPADADMAEAAVLMGRRNVKKLVVTIDGKISGIISHTDIIRIAPSLYELTAKGKSA
ncbi:hypothetical protein AUJ14_04005 [Candidatus Micrarchaeota archaeon CG1_02_55_22]|nr:MAG: hypothetical protein AUJ14_04005 [Candidatus Micrarchaeota archaeon CG1_02_55_22]